MHLNGWQRMWVVFTVVTAIAALATAAAIREDYRLVPSLGDQIAMIRADATVVSIQDLGEFQFPAEMPEDVITELLKKGVSKSPPTIESIDSIANNAIREQAELEIRRLEAINTATQRINLHRYMRVGAAWLAGTIIVYAVGWSIGWVYRGFKSTD